MTLISDSFNVTDTLENYKEGNKNQFVYRS